MDCVDPEHLKIHLYFSNTRELLRFVMGNDNCPGSAVHSAARLMAGLMKVKKLVCKNSLLKYCLVLSLKSVNYYLSRHLKQTLQPGLPTSVIYYLL